MLNTDLHSQQVKKRMTKEDFIKNNRRIDGAGALSDEYFSKLFDEVRRFTCLMYGKRLLTTA